LRFAAAKETYALRSIRFKARKDWRFRFSDPPSNLESLEVQKSGEATWYAPKAVSDKIPLSLRLDFSQLARSDEIHFHGRVGQGENERVVILDGNEEVTVEWKDVDAEQQRDRLFIIIGVLIAVAATMLVEALKPWVEEYLRPH
jgi:hypothetical protein